MSETPEPVEAEALPEPQLPSPSKDARTMAMLAHLLCLFTGFIGPLIIYLIKKDEDRFVAFHSLQALYWELAICVCVFVSFILSIILCCFALPGMAVAIAGLVFNIILLTKANNGEWAEYPVVGGWVKK